MEALVSKQSGVRLLRIDMTNDGWDAPVGAQYGIRSLPTLWLYEGTERVSSDTRQVWGQLQQ